MDHTVPDKVTLTFNTTRFGVKLADGVFEASTTIGEIHARLRKKLLKALTDDVGHNRQGSSGGGDFYASTTMTHFFIRNGTEAFIPAPHQTLEELLKVCTTSKDLRTLAATIDLEVFCG
ncbi:unnamed protein product [Phytomonas sp. EM1]|nr:unnamed protein product [Phytomonas sp. EM1]|eukprot:CCW62232.1 unnamed protein product [Phytomonas sp. isolate EM1]